MNNYYKRKSHRKGQIELSANFIIVIVISIIIVVGGLAMFFKMKGKAQTIVDTLDSQTEDRIKSMMLSGTEHVAVYPSDPTIGPGDAKLVGVGVTNNFDNETNFTVAVTGIQRYTKANPDGEIAPGAVSKYSEISSPKLKLAPHSQGVKGVLLRMPENVKGQYVYTIQIDTVTTPVTHYGVVQVYVNNP
jgi:hypothetical protein